MKNVLFFSLLFLVLWTCDAFAVLTSCIGTTTCPDQNGCQYLNVVGCATGKDTFYGSYAVRSCLTCPYDYELVSKSLVVPGCTRAVFYNDCQATCIECPDCESEDWKMYVTPSGVIRIAYQRKVTAACNYATCVCSKKFQYRCNDGYYGRSINGLTGCYRCPINSSNGVRIWGNSVAGKNYSISGCFVASGGDESGDYMYSQDCYYKR